MTPRTIPGIHHITAIASDPQRTLDFYTRVLGLRMVKLTINFDDPGTYHFYFGNEAGGPGSIMTFFPWPGARRGTVGNGQVSATAFSVPVGSLDYWRARLLEHHVPAAPDGRRFGDSVLRFVDPDGLPLELVAIPDADPAQAWRGSPVAADAAICGFHSATLAEEGYESTAQLLVSTLGWRFVDQDGNRYRYRSPDGGHASTVDLVCSPDGPRGRLGAGTVHHIAWRTADDEQQAGWRADLAAGGFNVTPVMDRTYFRSIYFREPGGVLFEIATDPPGFTLDEPLARLGERLMLPDWLEPDRARVEAALPVLTR